MSSSRLKSRALGYVTCSWIDCPEPDAATRLLLDQGTLFLVKHGNDGGVRDVR